MTITEIEFFPPASCGDSLGNYAPVIPATDINLLDIGNVANAGAVKSIRQMVIESETVQKGESRKAEESEESKKGTSVAVKTDESVVEKVIDTSFILPCLRSWCLHISSECRLSIQFGKSLRG